MREESHQRQHDQEGDRYASRQAVACHRLGRKSSERVDLNLRPSGYEIDRPQALAMVFPIRLRRRLNLLVGNMRVAQRHRQMSVTEQLRYHWQRDALEDGLTGMGMSQIVQAHILDSGLLSDAVPELHILRHRPGGSAGRGEDMVASAAWLAFDDALSLRIKVHTPRPGLGVGEIEHVGLHLLPLQVDDLLPCDSR